MLTRTEYKLTTREMAVRYYRCPVCGAQGEVVFGAEGSSGWHREGLFDSDIDQRVQRAAENDLRTDAVRTQALIRCPTCDRRAPGAVRWVAIRIGFWVAIGIALPIASPTLALASLVLGAAAIWQGWRERGRFKRARSAVIVRLQPGKLLTPVEKPKPVVRRQLAPPPDLPQARVVVAPAPVIHEPPPDPSAPPKFLKP